MANGIGVRSRATGKYRAAITTGMVVLLAAVALPQVVLAQGLETDELLSRVESLYLSSGYVMPTVSTPVSHLEIASLVERLASHELAPGIADEVARLQESLAAASDTMVTTVGVSAHPEYYLGVDRGAFVDQVAREDPFATLLLMHGKVGGIFLVAEADLQREWQYDSSTTNIPAPVSGNPLPFENNLMYVGYVFLPVAGTEITFGRQSVHIGPDPRDSLMVSSRIPFLDALKLTLTLGNVKMTSVTSTIENGRAGADVTLPASTNTYDFDINTIFYNVHYFEFIQPRYRIGIGSQVMLARANNNFHLGDFFPVFSWHNADITPNNMSLLADVSAVVLPGLELFLQIGLDDINGSIVGITDSGVPTIDAYIGGANYRFPAIPLRLHGVAGYTHYLWGSFDLDDGLERAIWRLQADGPRMSMPLTSPYGPGALWCDLSATGEWHAWSAELSYRLLGQIPGVSIYTTPYEQSDAIEATARVWNHRVGLQATYDWSFGNVSVAPALVIDSGAASFELEISAEVEHRFVRVHGAQ